MIFSTRPSKWISLGALILGLVLFSGCSRNEKASMAAEDEALAEQYRRYERQLDITDAQLERNEALLAKQEQISERMLKLVNRWEGQAEGVDKLIKELEKK